MVIYVRGYQLGAPLALKTAKKSLAARRKNGTNFKG